MKRRNPECGKLRRPVKRSKIADGIYGSMFLYVKFLMIWVLVLLADFIVEFRFEYLWPFTLLLRSVYDSFKYQGLAFSVFFVCIAVTSDVICYLYIQNVQWLFFAASTYVWVQYVWQTERGICLPTVSLWLLFIYIEASVRLRDLKSDPLPFNLNLCRPFAAHCIGYPVVTLGFGFKSYISYRMRVRKQKDVRKDNEFYVHLLQEALPPEQQETEKQKVSVISGQGNSFFDMRWFWNLWAKTSHKIEENETSTDITLPSKAQEEIISNGLPSKKVSTGKLEVDKDIKKQSNLEDIQYIEQSLPSKPHSVNDYDEDVSDQNTKNNKANSVTKSTSSKLSNSQKEAYSASKKGKNNFSKENTANNFINNKDEVISRLEGDIKRLKADLQSSRNCEQELRSQINNYILGDKSNKSELYQLRQDNESLQCRLHNLVTSRQQDKQNLAILEKKLQEERKARAVTEQQLSTERKAKKVEEAARAVAMAAAARNDCTDGYKTRCREMENDIKQLRQNMKVREDQIRHLEIEAQTLRQSKEAQNETEVLMSALAAMQDKTAHLENSLSAETRLKLDLFSALGEAKRQMEIQQGLLVQKDQEIEELKLKLAEVMALVPSGPATPPLSHDRESPSLYSSVQYGNNAPSSPLGGSTDSPPLYPNSIFSSAPEERGDDSVLVKSTLNPNASDYTPKGGN